MEATRINGPEIVNSRYFAASRDRVFEAFSDPNELVKWFGPNGFTNTIQKFDLRAGGDWRLTMIGPDGAEFPNEWVFLEVVRPERIVAEHVRPVHRFVLTMLYEEEIGGTRLTWRMHLERDEGEKMCAFFSAANEQNFDRLAAHLANG
jgi:uncharacterized protein YndB with AHSA1/START domain